MPYVEKPMRFGIEEPKEFEKLDFLIFTTIWNTDQYNMWKMQGIVIISYKIKQTLIYIQDMFNMRQTFVKHKM